LAAKPRTPIEVRRDGIRALVEKLGPADAIRFIQSFDPGEGDYTAERHAWLDHLTVDEVIADIERRERE
jgi:hypothetical protein